MKAWGGRRAQLLTAHTLATKGTTCHLCRLEGADSADHDPPRSVLIEQGVVDPDDPSFLFPAHAVPCNVARRAEPITSRLRSRLRSLRLVHVAKTSAAESLSPRFAHRAQFLRDAKRSGSTL